VKTLGRIVLILILAVLVAGVIAYADGASLPINHSVSVAGVVPASPDKVFALISDVAGGAAWRSAVKSVTMLTPGDGPNGKQDHWVEHLGHGQTMTFLAVRSEAPTRRDVQLDDPNASYGGTWTYELSPGPSAGTTSLRITETGFIKPPIYRFMMAHVFGPTSNLDQYMADIKAAAGRP